MITDRNYAVNADDAETLSRSLAEDSAAAPHPVVGGDPARPGGRHYGINAGNAVTALGGCVGDAPGGVAS